MYNGEDRVPMFFLFLVFFFYAPADGKKKYSSKAHDTSAYKIRGSVLNQPVAPVTTASNAVSLPADRGRFPDGRDVEARG